jgi:hypothetical protein
MLHNLGGEMTRLPDRTVTPLSVTIIRRHEIHACRSYLAEAAFSDDFL